MVHPPCKSVQSCVICGQWIVLLLVKILYIPLCALQGGKSSYRQGSVLAWNQPWTWMNRRMTICQHPTGDVRTEKRTKNVSGKGAVYQNNTLNINLIYSCCLLHISSANSAVIVKHQSFSKVELSLHCQDRGLYTVIQLCSYAVLKWGYEKGWKKFYYII